MIFDDDLHKKRSLPRLLLWHFNIVKKLAFFQKGLTHDFGKKFETSAEFIFVLKRIRYKAWWSPT